MSAARAEPQHTMTPPRYVEIPPSPALAPWVDCYWSARGSTQPGHANRILPDGCADIIIDLHRAPYAFAVGPMRTASLATLSATVDLIAVRFRPGAGATLLGTPLDELCDRDVALDALWGALAAELEDRLATAPVEDRVRHLERILLRRLAPRRDDDRVARAVGLMRRSRGRAGVRDVAAALSVGERWLERAFARHVGYGPKTLARVVRFQHAVHLMQRAPVRSWTSLAFDAGYADQAHLVREFRALAGVTPVAYARERVGFVQDDGSAAR